MWHRDVHEAFKNKLVCVRVGAPIIISINKGNELIYCSLYGKDYMFFPPFFLQRIRYKVSHWQVIQQGITNVNKHTTQLWFKEWRNIPNKKHVVKIFHTNFSDKQYPPTCWGEIPPLFYNELVYSISIDDGVPLQLPYDHGCWQGYRHLNKIPRRPSLLYLNQLS